MSRPGRWAPTAEDVVRGAAATAPDRTPWTALLLRFFVLVPPAQVLGVLLGGALVSALAGPRVGAAGSILITGASGLVAGLALGLLVRPGRRLGPQLRLSAALGAASITVLFVVAATRLAGISGAGPGLAAYLAGGLLVTGSQTLVAWRLWRARGR